MLGLKEITPIITQGVPEGLLLTSRGRSSGLFTSMQQTYLYPELKGYGDTVARKM
jgi:hypothetical protein